MDKATTIKGAASYSVADDLWIITSYFNPNKYQTKLNNYTIFKEVIRLSNLNLITVECAFGDTPFTLKPAPDVLQVRGHHIMWQKERLLNIAIRNLPSRCRKVAWLDCDILFDNPDWAAHTSSLLDKYPVVQPFRKAVRLPKGHIAYEGSGEVWKGFGFVYKHYPTIYLEGHFDRHGHTGFAWAARKEILLEHGLYDACIAGSGDHMMAHAMCGDWESPCIDRIIGTNNKHLEYFRDWGERIYKSVQGRIGYTPGTILHLWHGDRSDRKYVIRNRDLAGFDFDPKSDLRIGEHGCWEWNSDKVEMHNWAVDYFGHRKEDGSKEIQTAA